MTESRSRALIGFSPLASCWRLTNDWTIVRASENLKAFLGVSAEQVLGQRFDSLISEQATHDIRNRMAMLFLTGAERLYGVNYWRGESALSMSLSIWRPIS